VVERKLRLLERQELARQRPAPEVEDRHGRLVVGDDEQPVAEPHEATGGGQVACAARGRRGGEQQRTFQLVRSS
jgi:hypothetical protein